MTREGNRKVDLKGAGIMVQTENGFGTGSAPILVEVGTGGFGTTAANKGSIYVAAKTKELLIDSITSADLVNISAEKAVTAKAHTDGTSNITAAALQIVKSNAVGTKDQNLKTNISGNMEISSTGDTM